MRRRRPAHTQFQTDKVSPLASEGALDILHAAPHSLPDLRPSLPDLSERLLELGFRVLQARKFNLVECDAAGV